jgi:Protein of unknown function (DUF2721)
MNLQLTDVSQVIQLAVAPVFLLTAIGTILSALSIRLGRIIDRRRVLEDTVRTMPPEGADELKKCRDELLTLARRIRLIYHAITFAVISGILVCLVVAFAFLGVFIRYEVSGAVAVMFAFAMLSLIGSLSMLLREVFLAIQAGRHTILLEDLGKL